MLTELACAFALCTASDEATAICDDVSLDSPAASLRVRLGGFLRGITVRLETVKIVDRLPELDIWL